VIRLRTVFHEYNNEIWSTVKAKILWTTF
jgi:hypothetical protein